MKLKENVKPLIKNKQCVAKLSLKFNVCGRAIEKAIDRNVENGYLTTLVALKVIRTHTGLTNKEILE